MEPVRDTLGPSHSSHEANRICWETKVLEAACIAETYQTFIANLSKLFLANSIHSDLFLVDINRNQELRVVVSPEVKVSEIKQPRMLNPLIEDEVIIQSWSGDTFSIVCKSDGDYLVSNKRENLNDLALSIVIPFSSTSENSFFLEISYPGSDKDSIRLQQNHLEFLEVLFRFQTQKRVFGDTDLVAFEARQNDKSYEVLTQRQNSIARLVARGLTNSEISREMHLSVSLVKLELSKIFRVLEITKRIELFD